MSRVDIKALLSDPSSRKALGELFCESVKSIGRDDTVAVSPTLERMLRYDRDEARQLKTQQAIARANGDVRSERSWARSCSTDDYFLAMEIIDEIIREEFLEKRNAGR